MQDIYWNHLGTFINQLILVRIAMDLEPIPGTPHVQTHIHNNQSLSLTQKLNLGAI